MDDLDDISDVDAINDDSDDSFDERRMMATKSKVNNPPAPTKNPSTNKMLEKRQSGSEVAPKLAHRKSTGGAVSSNHASKKSEGTQLPVRAGATANASTQTDFAPSDSMEELFYDPFVLNLKRASIAPPTHMPRIQNAAQHNIGTMSKVQPVPLGAGDSHARFTQLRERQVRKNSILTGSIPKPVTHAAGTNHDIGASRRTSVVPAPLQKRKSIIAAPLVPSRIPIKLNRTASLRLRKSSIGGIPVLGHGNPNNDFTFSNALAGAVKPAINRQPRVLSGKKKVGKLSVKINNNKTNVKPGAAPTRSRKGSIVTALPPADAGIHLPTINQNGRVFQGAPHQQQHHHFPPQQMMPVQMMGNQYMGFPPQQMARSNSMSYSDQHNKRISQHMVQTLMNYGWPMYIMDSGGVGSMPPANAPQQPQKSHARSYSQSRSHR